MFSKGHSTTFLRLLILPLALLLASGAAAARENGSIPAGAKVLFEDDYSQPAWSAARVEQGESRGLSGRVLAAESFGDTVRFEREVDFTLQEENFIHFEFYCTGYQRLRVLLWQAGAQNPKAAVLTHYPSGERQSEDIPLEHNFHDYHWRPAEYGALEPGDRITRMALEFSLSEPLTPRVAAGRLTVYSLTGEVYRARYLSALARAESRLAAVPESLAAARERLDGSLEEIRRLYERTPDSLVSSVKQLERRLDWIGAAADRMDRYYQPARSAAGLPEIDYCVGEETSLRRVTHLNPRLRFRGKVPAAPAVSLAANEHEAFQLVLLPFDVFLQEVRVSVSDLLGPSGRIGRENISVGRVQAVRTQVSPHSNGMDQGWAPDIILPLGEGETFTVPPEGESALWIDVHAPEGTPAGDYRATVTVTPANSHATVIPLSVRVYDYAIPLRGMFRTQGHFSIESVENFYHRKMDNRWLEQWYTFWLDYRFDPVGQYSPYLTPRPELIPFCLERGLKTINLGGFSTGEVNRTALDSVYRLIRQNGWLDYSYVYIGDETDNFVLMREKANVIHTRYPGVKVMIGGSRPREELIGYIDVWDPILRPGGVYGFEPGPCLEALERGEEVLWYVCIAPHPPFPNVQMEDPLADSRTLFWMTYKYDIMGYEYWWYDYWEKNERPQGEPRWPEVAWNSYSYDHTNGDGQICYPGPGGLPHPSVRLAVNRDGIEDWEALWLLEDLARSAAELGLDRQPDTEKLIRRARELAAVPDEVVRDLTHYTSDPHSILGHREEVSRMIVALQETVGKTRAGQMRERHIRERRELERRSLERNIARAKKELK